MVDKLFTPLTLGAFDLRHRMLYEGLTSIEALGGQLNIDWDWWRGGMVVHNQVDQRLRTALSSDLVELEGDGIRHLSRLLDETVRVMRLHVDLDSLSGPHEAAVDRVISAHIELARVAKDNGYDGVEIDGATGTILDAYLNSSGRAFGSAGKVAASPVAVASELIDALTTVFDRGRIGLRLSPFDATCATLDARSSYRDVLRTVGDFEIGYVNIRMTLAEGKEAVQFHLSDFANVLRRAFPGVIIASGMVDLQQAVGLIEARWADAVCFPCHALPEILAQI